MPSGKTHQRINDAAMALGAPTTFALTWYATGDPLQALTISAYALAGMIFGTYFADPDLDHDHITHTEARLRRIPFVGLLLYVAFVAFWYPYAKKTRHRGLSHSPIAGTLLRLGYILLMFTAINTIARCAIVGTPKGWGDLLLKLAAWIIRNPARAGAWIAGECLADILHALTEKLWPAAVHKTSARWRVPDQY
jgi:uncharacterized metal-binding protein